MSSLRTFLLASLLCLPLPAMAFPDSTHDRSRLFANCAGRLYAQLEHEWLMRDPASDRTKAIYDVTTEILDTIAPDLVAEGGDPAQITAWRIDARAAHRALIETGRFAGDNQRRTQALELARTLLSNCASLVPGV